VRGLFCSSAHLEGTSSQNSVLLHYLCHRVVSRSCFGCRTESYACALNVYNGTCNSKKFSRNF